MQPNHSNPLGSQQYAEGASHKFTEHPHYSLITNDIEGN